MPQLDDALHSFRDIEETLDYLSSDVIENWPMEESHKSSYYQKAEVLWKYAIVSNKDFPAVNTVNGVTKMFNEGSNHGQARSDIHICVNKSAGKRKRMTDDVGDADRTKYSAVSALHIDSQDTEAELSPVISHKDHCDALLISMYGLSGILGLRRKYLDDEQSPVLTLGWPERLIMSECPSILTGMHDLAQILAAQHKDEEAEELLRFTVDLMERELKLDDPEVMSSTSSLAFILIKRGKQVEAEAMYKKILKLKNRLLGWDDPDTEETLGHLGMMLKNSYKLKEAAELTACYRLPAVIRSIMLSTFPRHLLGLHIGLIDDHHDDDDVQAFLGSDTMAINEIRVCTGDDSLAVELLLDPEDLRMTFVVSLRALMAPQQKLQKDIKYCLEYGLGEWRDLGIDSYVCCVDEDDGGTIWALPQHLDL